MARIEAHLGPESALIMERNTHHQWLVAPNGCFGADLSEGNRGVQKFVATLDLGVFHAVVAMVVLKHG